MPTIVEELLQMDDALALLKQQYVDAAFRDDFQKADEFSDAQRLLAQRRQELWIKATDVELAVYEIERNERRITCGR